MDNQWISVTRWKKEEQKDAWTGCPEIEDLKIWNTQKQLPKDDKNVMAELTNITKDVSSHE